MKALTILTLSFFMQACAASEDCSSPETQYSMNICSGIKLSKLENELKRKEDTLSQYLEKIGSEKLFRLSNTAWYKFRNAHCESVSYVYEGGSIHSLIESECKILLTKERIINLSNDYKDTIDTIEKGSP